jgi:hypothetical protein
MNNTAVRRTTRHVPRRTTRISRDNAAERCTGPALFDNALDSADAILDAEHHYYISGSEYLGRAR